MLFQALLLLLPTHGGFYTPWLFDMWFSYATFGIGWMMFDQSIETIARMASPSTELKEQSFKFGRKALEHCKDHHNPYYINRKGTKVVLSGDNEAMNRQLCVHKVYNQYERCKRAIRDWDLAETFKDRKNLDTEQGKLIPHQCEWDDIQHYKYTAHWICHERNYPNLGHGDFWEQLGDDIMDLFNHPKDLWDDTLGNIVPLDLIKDVVTDPEAAGEHAVGWFNGIMGALSKAGAKLLGPGKTRPVKASDHWMYKQQSEIDQRANDIQAMNMMNNLRRQEVPVLDELATIFREERAKPVNKPEVCEQRELPVGEKCATCKRAEDFFEDPEPVKYTTRYYAKGTQEYKAVELALSLMTRVTCKKGWQCPTIKDRTTCSYVNKGMCKKDFWIRYIDNCGYEPKAPKGCKGSYEEVGKSKHWIQNYDIFKSTSFTVECDDLHRGKRVWPACPARDKKDTQWRWEADGGNKLPTEARFPWAHQTLPLYKFPFASDRISGGPIRTCLGQCIDSRVTEPPSCRHAKTSFTRYNCEVANAEKYCGPYEGFKKCRAAEMVERKKGQQVKGDSHGRHWLKWEKHYKREGIDGTIFEQWHLDFPYKWKLDLPERPKWKSKKELDELKKK